LHQSSNSNLQWYFDLWLRDHRPSCFHSFESLPILQHYFGRKYVRWKLFYYSIIPNSLGFSSCLLPFLKSETAGRPASCRFSEIWNRRAALGGGGWRPGNLWHSPILSDCPLIPPP
jgi:hypothetical protein